MRAPGGFYHGDNPKLRYTATGEYRPPRRGEYYLSGAIITAYRAPNNLTQSYWIASPRKRQTCPTCGRLEE